MINKKNQKDVIRTFYIKSYQFFQKKRLDP